MPLPVYLAWGVSTLVAAFATFRVVARRDYVRRGRLTPVSSVLETAVLAGWVYFTYVNRPPDWPAYHVGPALRVAGWVLFAGGLALTAVAMTRLGVRRSLGLEVSGLEASGLYRTTRNPQVVAFGAAMIGYVMLWPSWRNAGAVVLYWSIVHMMVITEEEHLRDRHGTEYDQYRRRVPRYLGSRGRSPRAAG
jgi:protein-S-isoprenylcysteine O-methyltransferase Ste14